MTTTTTDDSGKTTRVEDTFKVSDRVQVEVTVGKRSTWGSNFVYNGGGCGILNPIVIGKRDEFDPVAEAHHFLDIYLRDVLPGQVRAAEQAARERADKESEKRDANDKLILAKLNLEGAQKAAAKAQDGVREANKALQAAYEAIDRNADTE